MARRKVPGGRRRWSLRNTARSAASLSLSSSPPVSLPPSVAASSLALDARCPEPSKTQRLSGAAGLPKRTIMEPSFWKQLQNSASEAPKICVDFLNNRCQSSNSTCPNVHTKYSFLWQVERLEKWHNFPEVHNYELESKFCVVSSDGVDLSSVNAKSGEQYFDPNDRWYADFEKMTVEGFNLRLKIRRLSTESSVVRNDQFCKRYQWFFKDEQSRWILYGKSIEQSPALRTTSSSDDIEYEVSVNKRKVWSIHSAQYKYELDFVTMTQTNQQTQVARPIRRRPVASKIITGSGDSSDITPSPMPESFVIKEHKWQFMDEQNQWIDYGCVSSGNDHSCVVTATSKDIEKEFERNPKGNMQIQSASNRYYLDFNSMKQTNMQTNVTRDVRRVLEGGCGMLNKLRLHALCEDDNEEVGTFKNDEFEWFFCDENNQWVKYGQVSSGKDQNCVPTQDSDDIERHFRTQSGDVMTIKSSKHTYELNLSAMMQTNVKTRVQRPICRQVKGRGGGNGGKVQEIDRSIHGTFQWYFKHDDGSWVVHGSEGTGINSFSSSDIEKHYLQNPSTNLNFKLGGNSYTIDFTKMTQINVSTGKIREIRRQRLLATMSGACSPAGLTTNFAQIRAGQRNFVTPLSSAKIMQKNAYSDKIQEIRRQRLLASRNGACSPAGPTTNLAQIPAGQRDFATPPSSSDCFVTPLSSSDGEYRTCLQLLRRPSVNFSPKQIVKIHDPHLKAIFNIRKRKLQGMYPSVVYSEKTLFHGTGSTNIKSILEENIDWRLHGSKNGQAMGRGAYFSSCAQTSLRYGQVLFICKVLVGLVTTGNANTVRPPRDASNRLVDTVVNQVANPTIFVKFDTQEYYPEYYVEC